MEIILWCSVAICYYLAKELSFYSSYKVYLDALQSFRDLATNKGYNYCDFFAIAHICYSLRYSAGVIEYFMMQVKMANKSDGARNHTRFEGGRATQVGWQCFVTLPD